MEQSQLKEYFENQAERYDELCTHLEFQVEDAFDYAASFLKKDLQEVTAPKLLELGTGTGGFTEYLLKKLPKASILGLDLSESMLELAAKKLAPWSDRLQLQEGDFQKRLPGDGYHAVVSAMTFQFYGINHSRLLRRIHRCLAYGASVLTILNVSSENSRNDLMLCELLQQSADIPEDDKEWLAEARGKSRFCPAPPSWYLALLRRGGFIDQECIYLRYGVAIFIARKPYAQGYSRQAPGS